MSRNGAATVPGQRRPAEMELRLTLRGNDVCLLVRTLADELCVDPSEAVTQTLIGLINGTRARAAGGSADALVTDEERSEILALFARET